VLAKAHRLTGADAFSSTVRTGGRAGSATLVAHLLLPAEVTPPRVGLIVSKAVGDAVTRNRVKRRLRHAAAAHLAELPAGSLLVLRALPAAGTASFAALERDLTRSLRRLLREPGRHSGPTIPETQR
jgi:ribonuclease P protein component